MGALADVRLSLSAYVRCRGVLGTAPRWMSIIPCYPATFLLQVNEVDCSQADEEDALEAEVRTADLV